MKAILACNFTKMNNCNTNDPKFGGGPTSAFSPYKIHTESNIPESLNKRKDAFRRLKTLFGIKEPVSTKTTSTSQK